jgi:hypothetical protein
MDSSSSKEHATRFDPVFKQLRHAIRDCQRAPLGELRIGVPEAIESPSDLPPQIDMPSEETIPERQHGIQKPVACIRVSIGAVAVQLKGALEKRALTEPSGV